MDVFFIGAFALQLRLQTVLHEAGAVGNRIRHHRRLNPANNPTKQIPVPGFAGR